MCSDSPTVMTEVTVAALQNQKGITSYGRPTWDNVNHVQSISEEEISVLTTEKNMSALVANPDRKLLGSILIAVFAFLNTFTLIFVSITRSLTCTTFSNKTRKPVVQTSSAGWESLFTSKFPVSHIITISRFHYPSSFKNEAYQCIFE